MPPKAMLPVDKVAPLCPQGTMTLLASADHLDGTSGNYLSLLANLCKPSPILKSTLDVLNGERKVVAVGDSFCPTVYLSSLVSKLSS